MNARGDRVTASKPGTLRNGCASTQKKCAACGEMFACGAPDSNCWCEEVTLSPSALESLRARYADCICPRCLAAQKFGGSPRIHAGEGALQRSVKKPHS